MQTEHTPRPWRIGDAGHTVFGPKTDAPSPQTVASNLTRANVALIGRAVNSAPEIFEQLKYTADFLAEQAEAMKPGAVREALQGRAVCLRAVLDKIERKG